MQDKILNNNDIKCEENSEKDFNNLKPSLKTKNNDFEDKCDATNHAQLKRQNTADMNRFLTNLDNYNIET